jgi:hypothetical protein
MSRYFGDVMHTTIVYESYGNVYYSSVYICESHTIHPNNFEYLVKNEGRFGTRPQDSCIAHSGVDPGFQPQSSIDGVSKCE